MSVSRLQHVPIRLRVSVDPQAWVETYGTEPARAAVADDVRRYVVTQVQESAAAHEGAIVAVRRDQL